MAKSPRRPLFRPLAVTTISIFVVESSIMLLLPLLPPAPWYAYAILDSLLLTATIFVILSLFFFRRGLLPPVGEWRGEEAVEQSEVIQRVALGGRDDDRRPGRASPRGYPSPLRLLVITTASIFAAETAIMSLLPFLPPLPTYANALLDSLLLTAIVFPMLHHLFLRQTISHIEERRRTENYLRTSEESFQAIVAKSDEGILIVDKKGMVHYVNPAGETFMGRKADDLIGSKVSLPFSNSSSAEMEITRKSGERGIGEIRVVETEWGGKPAHLVSLRDVTENARLREELKNLSITDDLTGLHNRRGFFQLARHQISVARRTSNEILTIFVDLDDLKGINDTFGHLEGDLALTDAANILRETFREADIIARTGGDEFVVLALETGGVSGDIFTSRLKKNLEAHNRRGNRRHKLSFSVGVARYDPERSRTVDELLSQADKMMYEQKNAKKKSAT